MCNCRRMFSSRRARPSAQSGPIDSWPPRNSRDPMAETSTSISQPPTPLEYGWDWAFRKLTFAMALACIGTVVLLVVQIAITAAPAISEHGLAFLTTNKWNPRENEIGIAPQIA